MKAIHADLLTFLDGTKQFQVPIFQRRYDWKEKECKQLWDDVLRVGENEDIPSYFLGSIVSMQHGIYHASGISSKIVIFSMPMKLIKIATNSYLHSMTRKP